MAEVFPERPGMLVENEGCGPQTMLRADIGFETRPKSIVMQTHQDGVQDIPPSMRSFDLNKRPSVVHHLAGWDMPLDG